MVALKERPAKDKINHTEKEITEKGSRAKGVEKAVFIDDQPVAGLTPVKVRTGLQAGRTYRLRLERQDYEQWTSTFEAQHGRVQQIAVMTPRRAVLRVDTAPPRAHVWVDGVLRGIAPIEIQDLPPGQPVDVRASKPGYLETRQRVEIAPDDLSPAVTIVLPRKRR